MAILDATFIFDLDTSMVTVDSQGFGLNAVNTWANFVGTIQSFRGCDGVWWGRDGVGGFTGIQIYSQYNY